MDGIPHFYEKIKRKEDAATHLMPKKASKREMGTMRQMESFLLTKTVSREKIIMQYIPGREMT